MTFLDRCPFCGAKAQIDSIGAHCSNDSCGGHLIRDLTSITWNTRAPQQTAQSEDARDAARYRYMCEMKSWPEEINAAFDCSPKGVIDDLIDAAIQKESGNVTDEFFIAISNRAKACSSCYGSGFTVGSNLCPCGRRPRIGSQTTKEEP